MFACSGKTKRVFLLFIETTYGVNARSMCLKFSFCLGLTADSRKSSLPFMTQQQLVDMDSVYGGSSRNVGLPRPDAAVAVHLPPSVSWTYRGHAATGDGVRNVLFSCHAVDLFFVCFSISENTLPVCCCRRRSKPWPTSSWPNGATATHSSLRFSTPPWLQH